MENTIISEAQAEAARITGQADAEANRTYAEAYSADPEFFEFYTSLESYRKTLPDMTKVLSADSGYFQYL